MHIFPTRMCNVTAWRCLEGRRGWRRSMYSAFPGNCSVCYLSFVYGRSQWAELNGGENFLHWKANMLLLFSIMTLWFQRNQLSSANRLRSAGLPSHEDNFLHRVLNQSPCFMPLNGVSKMRVTWSDEIYAYRNR